MRKSILFIMFFAFIANTYSQRLKNENYELFLLEFNENEVDISEGMYMTDNKQYYYEGIIEVTYLNNGNTTNFNFFFSSWDDRYKNFIIKDANYNEVKPIIYFEDKITAHIKGENQDIETKLLNNSSLENSMLSSMIVWLDNQIIK